MLRRLEGHSDNSISLILCWILQAEYLYATGQLRSAKETIVRARSRAESLNPRKKSTKNPDNVPAAEKVFIQLGRAIWLGIQAIEQSLCLHLGKGTDGTSSETVPHPTSLVLKASQFPGDTLGEESLKGLILGLFTCCGELFRIMSKLPLERACGVTEGRCPLEKLQNAEIDPFTDVSQVENALHSWRRRLPQPLQWTGGIESNPRNEDPSLVRRMRILPRLRYVYMCLRMWRPFLILGLSLSHDCFCGRKNRPNNGPNIRDHTSPAVKLLV